LWRLTHIESLQSGQLVPMLLDESREILEELPTPRAGTAQTPDGPERASDNFDGSIDVRGRSD
jgi:hypothetical protein